MRWYEVGLELLTFPVPLTNAHNRSVSFRGDQKLAYTYCVQDGLRSNMPAESEASGAQGCVQGQIQIASTSARFEQ